MKRTEYVVGFMFDPERDNVLLIHKNRPRWQCGKLNGIGGHIEDGETPVLAIVREFEEETGIGSVVEDWTHYATVIGEVRDSWRVYFFYAEGPIKESKCMTEEILQIFPLTERLTDWDVIGNLHYLIPLALNCKSDGGGSQLVLPVEFTEVPK